jgi:hypothetical protein
MTRAETFETALTEAIEEYIKQVLKPGGFLSPERPGVGRKELLEYAHDIVRDVAQKWAKADLAQLSRTETMTEELAFDIAINDAINIYVRDALTPRGFLNPERAPELGCQDSRSQKYRIAGTIAAKWAHVAPPA